MADKLGTFNAALRKLGQRKLASLSEAVEARRVLDDLWTDAVTYCLEQGFWRFARRSVEIAAEDAVEPAFGYTYAFTVPEDLIKLYQISDNEFFDPPLNEYREEAGYWYAEIDVLCVSYVSSDATKGFDLSRWPASFTEYVATRLAQLACVALTQSSDRTKDLMADERRAKKLALSHDAMRGPVAYPPTGSWVLSRSRGAGWF